MLSELPRLQTVYYCYIIIVVVVVIIIIVSGSTVRVRTLAASQRRLRNLVKTLGREGSFARVISPLQRLHRATQHRNTRTNIYELGMIRTKMGTHNRIKMDAVHGTCCAVPSRNTNQQPRTKSLAARALESQFWFPGGCSRLSVLFYDCICFAVAWFSIRGVAPLVLIRTLKQNGDIYEVVHSALMNFTSDARGGFYTNLFHTFISPQ
jgi:hypothetical protein